MSDTEKVRTLEDVQREFNQAATAAGYADYRAKRYEADRNTAFNRMAELDNEAAALAKTKEEVAVEPAKSE